MRRRLLTGVVAAGLMTGMLAGPASAYAWGDGNSLDAPGFWKAYENCGAALARQEANGAGVNNPNKGLGPLNCDHYWG